MARGVVRTSPLQLPVADDGVFAPDGGPRSRKRISVLQPGPSRRRAVVRGTWRASQRDDRQRRRLTTVFWPAGAALALGLCIEHELQLEVEEPHRQNHGAHVLALEHWAALRVEHGPGPAQFVDRGSSTLLGGGQDEIEQVFLRQQRASARASRFLSGEWQHHDIRQLARATVRDQDLARAQQPGKAGVGQHAAAVTAPSAGHVGGVIVTPDFAVHDSASAVDHHVPAQKLRLKPGGGSVRERWRVKHTGESETRRIPRKDDISSTSILTKGLARVGEVCACHAHARGVHRFTDLVHATPQHGHVLPRGEGRKRRPATCAGAGEPSRNKPGRAMGMRPLKQHDSFGPSAA